MENGIESKLGVKVAEECDLIVFGDYIMHIYYSEKMLEIWDEIYANTKDFSDFKFLTEMDLLTSKKLGKINVIIVKNEKVAESIRKKSLKYFLG